MKHDLIVLEIVAVRAQLRRIQRLAESIGSGDELKARLPPLIAETRHRVEVLCSRIGQQEREGD